MNKGKSLKRWMYVVALTGCFWILGGKVKAAEPTTVPKLEITLKDTSLGKIKVDKNVKYENNTVTLVSDAHPSYNFEASGVEIKGRGNATWVAFEKKGYQIKFEEKISVLGMDKAKKWVLLAAPKDDTLMRNYIAMELANEVGCPFTPAFQYVELWFNGKYEGLYIIGEKVEIGKNRVDLKNPDGAIWEMDNAFWEEEKNTIYDELLQAHFVLKDCQKDEDKALVEYCQTIFTQKMDGFIKFLKTKNPNRIKIEDLAKYIDVDSFAKYMLVEEYITNRDSICGMSSCFFYVDGAQDVIHAGPVWDLEDSMGVIDVQPEQYIGTCFMLNYYLLRIPAFRNYMNNIYNTYNKTFQALPDRVRKQGMEIAAPARRNYEKWQVLGTSVGTETTYCETYDQAVERLANWLERRYQFFRPLEWKPDAKEKPVSCYSFEILQKG